MDSNKNTFSSFFADIAWEIYVNIKWRKNKELKELLLSNIHGIRDNLGYYLMYGHSGYREEIEKRNNVLGKI